MPPATPPRSVADPLVAFAHRDLSGWRGLAEGTTLADLKALVEVDEGFAGRAQLGSGYVPTDWVAAVVDGFPDGIRVWLREGIIVLLDAQRFSLRGSLEDLLAERGEPAARWQASLGPLPLAGSEWAFPESGLTLYLDSKAAWLDRVLAYPPTTLNEYEAELRPHSEIRPFPETGEAR
jgi:hypothetical protein